MAHDYMIAGSDQGKMNTIAEFRVPAENLALSATLAALDVDFEAERVTAYGIDRVLALLWATGSPETLAALDGTLEEDSSVESVELVASLDDERPYRIQWVKDVRFVVHILSRRTQRYSASSISLDDG